jgi:hypothetical protein
MILIVGIFLFSLILLFGMIFIIVTCVCKQKEKEQNERKKKIKFTYGSPSDEKKDKIETETESKSMIRESPLLMHYSNKNKKNQLSYGAGTGGTTQVNFNEPVEFEWNMNLTDTAGTINEPDIVYILHSYNQCSDPSNPTVASCTKVLDYTIPRDSNLTVTGTGLLTYQFKTTEDTLGITEGGDYFFSIESKLPNDTISGSTQLDSNAPDVYFKNEASAYFASLQTMSFNYPTNSYQRGVLAWVQYIDSTMDISSLCYTFELIGNTTSWYYDQSANGKKMDFKTLGFETRDRTNENYNYPSNHTRTITTVSEDGRSMTVRFVPVGGTNTGGPNSWLSSWHYKVDPCSYSSAATQDSIVYMDEDSNGTPIAVDCKGSSGSSSSSKCYRVLFLLKGTQPFNNTLASLPNANIGSDFIRMDISRFTNGICNTSSVLHSSYSAVIYQYQTNGSTCFMDIGSNVKILSCTDNNPYDGTACPYVVDACKLKTITPTSNPKCDTYKPSNPAQSATSCSGAVITIETLFFSMSANNLTQNEKTAIANAMKSFLPSESFYLEFLLGTSYVSNYSNYDIEFNLNSNSWTFSKKLNVFVPPQSLKFTLNVRMNSYRNGPYDNTMVFAIAKDIPINTAGPAPTNLVVH